MEKTKISLGFSPCPNDCFMFDALVHGKIDTKGLKFEAVMEDVETLNKKAFAGELDVTKLSYHAFAYLTDKYQLLTSGSALGFNCGPLLIGQPSTVDRVLNDNSLLDSMRIAIPGKFTTANFLLSLAYPNLHHKQEMVFSKIEQAVISGEVDLGLIIHENRFTYQQKGLKKVIDLGEWWESNTGNAIPLGGIVVKRDIAQEQKLLINDLVRQSVEYAFANPAHVMPFVKAHAQEMDEQVMKQHIDLYVNKYSVDLGPTGRKAVKDLFEKAVREKIIKAVPSDFFVN
jgi:1,4-dihydroxy-6-naphthoate synthase